MLKFVTQETKLKNNDTKISAPTLGSQVPNLGDYDPNQIIEIKGDL